MFFEWYFRTLQSLQETPHFPPDLPGRLTYDCGGFYGVDHLLQGLQVWVLVSKLLLLVVKVASSLNLWKKKYFSPHRIPHGSMLNTWGYLWRLSQWDTRITFTMRPLESTIQILLAASSLVSPSLAMAIISRWAIPRAACQKKRG